MKVAYLFVVGLFWVAVACERHSFEETKVLSEVHGADSHAEHAEEAGHAAGEDAKSGDLNHEDTGSTEEKVGEHEQPAH